MVFLNLFSIALGFVASDLMVGWGTAFWGPSFALEPSSPVDAFFLSPFQKALPVILSMTAFLGGYAFISFLALPRRYRNFVPGFQRASSFFSQGLKKLSPFFYHAGFFSHIYGKAALQVQIFSYGTGQKLLEKGWLEYVGPFGCYKFFRLLSLSLRTIPSLLSANFFTLFLAFSSLFLLFTFFFLGEGVFFLLALMILLLESRG